MEGERLGPYRVIRRLGSGGMGDVVLAEIVEDSAPRPLGEQVALKIVHAHLHTDPGHLDRFMREAEIGRAVQHENVGRFLGRGAYMLHGQERHILVMEYVPGQTLRGLLEEMGQVPEQLCLHIAREIAKGLAAIHAAGVVHRDLKPENVMITPDHRVKVVDFGVARLLDATLRLSRTGMFLGSIEYAAPEQFSGGDVDVDGRADLHGLGVLLYELSTGKHPYRLEDPRKVLHAILNETPKKIGELSPQLSPFFEEVVSTLLAKDRDLRFPGTDALLEVLDQGERCAWWRNRSHVMREVTHEPLRRMRIPRETGLYGRESELIRIQRVYEAARSGEGRTLLIEGEIGIGKTRLVDEFVHRLREEGEELNFLFGSYLPGGAATFSGALAAAYREHFGEDELEDALLEVLPATPALVPAFAAVLRGEPPPPDVERLTSSTLATLFVRTTQALARMRPTVILLEDLHFAPEEARAIFTALAQASVDNRTLLIGTFRPDVPTTWVGQIERMPHAERLVLPRLGARDLVELLADAFHSDALAEDLSGRIALKSDGNPFFVFEIIRALREEGLIRQRSDGAWVTTDAIGEVSVPSTVSDLVHARLGELEREDRELLELAACCGFEFDPIVVTAAAGTERLPTLKRLGHIERRHRLVHSLGSKMVFDHHQVHEALYKGLMERLREEYHRALAVVYEAEAGSHDVEIAEHFVSAGETGCAWSHVPAALRTLAGAFLHERAVLLVRSVLDAPGLVSGKERAGLLFDLAGWLDFLGRGDEQAEAIAEARRLSDDLADPSIQLRAHMAEGYFSFTRARYAEATTSYETALEIAVGMGNRDGESEAVSMLGGIAQQTGRLDVMSSRYQQWLEIAEEIGDDLGIAGATGGLGNVCLLQGRNEEAATLFERYRELAVAGGGLRAEGVATGNLSTTLRYLGRYGESLGHAQRRLELARAAGDRRAEGIASLNLGGLQTAMGDFEQARRNLERAQRVCRETGSRREEGTVLHGLGDLAVEEERWVEGEALLVRALERRRELRDSAGAAAVSLSLGRALAMQGRLAEADAHLLEALEKGRADQIAAVLVLVPGLRAVFLGGDVSEAISAWRAHEKRLYFADRIEAGYRLHEATGDEAYLLQARGRLQWLVEQAPAGYREALTRGRPLFRAIW